MIPSMTQKTLKPWYLRLLEFQLTQIALAAIILALDFASGPLVQFPIASSFLSCSPRDFPIRV
jgi:hypothetical protein